MAQITWGDGEGAGKVHFNGHVSLSGCALVNAGAPNEGLVLAKYTNPGTGCLGLWRMDEAAWNGTVGEVVDVKSLSNGQAFDGVTTTAEGMTRCGSFGPDTGGTKYVSLPYAAGYAGAQFAFGCWLKWDGAGSRMLFTRNGANAAHWGFFVYVTPDGALQLRTYTNNQAIVYTADGVIPSGEWAYCAASYDGSAQAVYVYSGDGLASASQLRVGNLRGGSSASHIGKYFGVSNAATLLIDEAATWSTGQAQSVFDALAYYYQSAAQNGSVQPYADLSYTGLSGTTPSQISWTAQTGASYGKVHSVWVLDGVGGWTQVGGAYPTSPITTGLSALTLGADSCVRFALEPKADAIQSETPTLQDVTLEYASPTISNRRRIVTPYRLGPRIVPIGVIG